MGVVATDAVFIVLLIPYVVTFLHSTAQAAGMLEASLSFGVIAVSFIVGRAWFDKSLWMWVSVMAFSIATAAMSVAPSVIMASALQVVAGLGVGIFQVRSTSTFQTLVTSQNLGKTLMVSGSISTIVQSGATALAGIGASTIGVPRTFAVFGVFVVAASVIAWFLLPKQPPRYTNAY